MLKNEYECLNININAQNWALMTKMSIYVNFWTFFPYLCPTRSVLQATVET